MEYQRLGTTGLSVSRICLGCMSYGDPDAAAARAAARAGSGRCARTSRAPSSSARSSSGINFFDTANVYSLGAERGDHRPRAARTSPRREEVVIATKVYGPMRAGAERPRPVAQGDPARDRRQPEAPRHRLRRPLPDPPLGRRDAHRGDDGGAARRREGGQGALPRRLVDVRLAVRQGAARRRAERLDALRLDAEPLQPALPRGGARDGAALPRPGRRA